MGQVIGKADVSGQLPEVQLSRANLDVVGPGYSVNRQYVGQGVELVTPYFKEWYHAQHDRNFANLTGVPFEDYLTSVLEKFHADFINPDPAGNLGDYKCDGVADAGRIVYASYGSRPEPGSTETAIVNKINSDFEGALSKWDVMEEWRFVTNARTGPECAKAIASLQLQHEEGSERHVRVRLWSESKLWEEVVSKLDRAALDLIFPGAPGLVSPELADLVPIIEMLNNDTVVQSPIPSEIRQVPPTKMDFNQLSGARRAEFNVGRRQAPRIEAWYSRHTDPGAFDRHSERFRRIYDEHRANHNDSDEIMESLYESLTGAGFRRDSRLSNAVYAVTSYFFDACSIFEEPPPDWEVVDAVAD